MRKYARPATDHWQYLLALWLVHSVAKYISHAYVMRGSERYSPRPFPTYESCRAPNGQVMCNRSRLGIGPPCQERCLILQQMTNLSKSSHSSGMMRDRA